MLMERACGRHRQKRYDWHREASGTSLRPHHWMSMSRTLVRCPSFDFPPHFQGFLGTFQPRSIYWGLLTRQQPVPALRKRLPLRCHRGDPGAPLAMTIGLAEKCSALLLYLPLSLVGHSPHHELTCGRWVVRGGVDLARLLGHSVVGMPLGRAGGSYGSCGGKKGVVAIDM